MYTRTETVCIYLLYICMPFFTSPFAIETRWKVMKESASAWENFPRSLLAKSTEKLDANESFRLSVTIKRVYANIICEIERGRTSDKRVLFLNVVSDICRVSCKKSHLTDYIITYCTLNYLICILNICF